MSSPTSSERNSEREAIRTRLLRAFEARLDEALAGPELPLGLATELLEDQPADAEDRAQHSEPRSHSDLDSKSDLYSVWAAVTALSQEVKLQGRSFKQLADQIEPLARDASLLGDTAANFERVIATQVARARVDVQRDRLELFFNLRERLERGDSAGRTLIAQANEAPRNHYWRRRSTEKLDSLKRAAWALAEGYTLALAEIDAALGQLGVSRIECVGKPFDPHSMQAVALERSDAEEGLVLEVLRAGYLLGDEILRIAQVKVASRRSHAPSHSASEESS